MRGLLDPAYQVVTILQLRTLRTHQPENYGLAAGDKAQRSKGSRAVVIVFQKETVNVDAAEELLRDRVIAAFGIPVAAIIAAAKVHAQRQARPAGRIQDPVVRADE